MTAAKLKHACCTPYGCMCQLLRPTMSMHSTARAQHSTCCMH